MRFLESALTNGRVGCTFDGVPRATKEASLIGGLVDLMARLSGKRNKSPKSQQWRGTQQYIVILFLSLLFVRFLPFLFSAISNSI